MRELPILMAGRFMGAIFEGKKTETRRPTPDPVAYRSGEPYPWYMRNRRGAWDSFKDVETLIKLRSPYQVGDHLYVRETYALIDVDGRQGICYAADYDEEDRAQLSPWRPSIYMPKWAARCWLEVTHVYLERVTDLTLRAALAEGFKIENNEPYDFAVDGLAIANFRKWWQQRYGKDAWSDRRWVFVYQFRRIER